MSLSAKLMCLLNSSRDENSTNSLGSWFQCLKTLSVKNFSLRCYLNLPWNSLGHLLLAYCLLCGRRCLPLWYQHSAQAADRIYQIWLLFFLKVPYSSVIISFSGDFWTSLWRRLTHYKHQPDIPQGACVQGWFILSGSLENPLESSRVVIGN